MDLKVKIGSIWKFIFYLFITLFPILPEYFRIAGIPVHEYLSLVFFVSAFLHGVKRYKFNLCLKWMLPIVVCSAVSYGYFGEITSFIAFMLQSVASMSVIIFYVESKRDVDRILDVVIYTGLFICLGGLVEKYWGYNVFSLIENVDLVAMGTSPTIRNDIVRVESSFGSPITLGVYLLFVNMAIIYRFKSNDRRGKNIVYCLTYILTFIIIYLTDSRMVLITLLLLQMMFFLRARKNKKIIALFLAIFVVEIDYASGQLLWKFLSKYVSLITDLLYSGDGVSDLTSSYRLMLIPTLLPYIMKHPFFGYGKMVMQNFTFSIWGHTYYSVDNGILAELLWHGLFGLIKMLLPLAYGFYFSIRRMKRDKHTGYCFFCVFLMYAINLISVAQMSEKRVLFLMVALIMSLEIDSEKRKVMV